MRREIHVDPSRIFSYQGSPSTSYYVCENSATQPDLQCYNMPTFLSKEEGGEGTPKEENLGEYLQEYESQSKIFKYHLSFPNFYQLKEERRSYNYSRRRGCMQPTLGRLSLPTFDGSPKDNQILGKKS